MVAEILASVMSSFVDQLVALQMKRLHNVCAAKPLANVSLCQFDSPGYIE